MRFVCLGYFDEAAWNLIPTEEQQSFMEACFAYDDELRWGGHFTGGMGLKGQDEAVTIRLRDGKPAVSDGPFTETKELIGGILFLEARDLNHAIQLMSKHPGVRSGGFEIRAVDESLEDVYQQWKKKSAESVAESA